MPLLGEFSSVQPSLHIHSGTVRAQSVVHSKALSSSFIFRSRKRLVSPWKSLNLSSKMHSNVKYFKIRRGRVFVTAVATLETQSGVQKQDGSSMQIESAHKDSEEVDEKERLRRMRISQSLKGNTPWNKGGKHTAETRQLISERTRIAMKNCKVRRKPTNVGGHAQSAETREKIAAALKRRYKRLREVRMLQESYYFEWQNLIAEASRTGFAGEDELQWDSYKILKEQIHEKWLESVGLRKATKPKGCTRAPKTPEQRRKIAAAITAMWTNPEYRERISSTKSKNRGAMVGVEREPRKKCNTNTQSTEEKGSKNKAGVSQNCMTKSKAQEAKKHYAEYKDPLASSKLKMIKNIRAQREAAETRKTEAIEAKEHDAEYKDSLASSKLDMIKNIRAQREAAESRKTEAIERARALIAETEMAMNALELAAEKSPVARAALVETRGIIAEAICSLESLKMKQAITGKNGEEPSIEIASCVGEGINEHINGAQTHSCRTEQQNGVLDKMVEEETPKSNTKTKKWVHGRLVEVSGEVQDCSMSEEVEDSSLSEEEDWSLSEEVYENIEDWS